MSDWKTLKSEVVYETPWIKVRRDEVLNHKGKPLTYSVIESRPSVMIVAVNAEKEVLLQLAYKYPVDKQLWAMPAGFIDDGESPLAAAQRELREEAHMISDDWIDLGVFYTAVGIGKISFTVFLARDVRPIKEKEDELEDIIRHEFKPVAEIERMVATGDFHDSPVVTALYSAKIHGI